MTKASISKIHFLFSFKVKSRDVLKYCLDIPDMLLHEKTLNIYLHTCLEPWDIYNLTIEQILVSQMCSVIASWPMVNDHSNKIAEYLVQNVLWKFKVLSYYLLTFLFSYKRPETYPWFDSDWWDWWSNDEGKCCHCHLGLVLNQLWPCC